MSSSLCSLNSLLLLRDYDSSQAIADLASIAHEELLATDHANLKATPYTAPTDRRRSVLEKRHRRKETFVKANEDVSSLVIKKVRRLWTSI